ncbi:VOC family protein [[Pseudomonas] carboxydohydrogena]|uniref:VOC family protein n=1 Tax=Afipia carboxydohydrogena TaxID=290 RepID=A0ABY8BT68_AFICR|nr:VOC family protein [[Pseudomonas] carboxydohydrogena]WEF52879.1 VOC family protein [[Pseudomonas] carboxydohydrogena]
MFTHVMVGSNNIEASRKFYDAIFTAVGWAAGTVDPKGRVAYTDGTARFLVTKPINGQPASSANGGTIGLNIKNPGLVDAWHAAGVANGGTTVEDPPGVRESGGKKVYLAYLRDPDGNKLCARSSYPG